MVKYGPSVPPWIHLSTLGRLPSVVYHPLLPLTLIGTSWEQFPVVFFTFFLWVTASRGFVHWSMANSVSGFGGSLCLVEGSVSLLLVFSHSSINHPVWSVKSNRMTERSRDHLFFIENCWLPAPYCHVISLFDLTEATDWLLKTRETESQCLQASFSFLDLQVFTKIKISNVLHYGAHKN